MLYTKLKTPFGAEAKIEIGLEDLFVDCPDCGRATKLFNCGEEYASYILWNDIGHYTCDDCSGKRGAICKACGNMKDGECYLYDEPFCELRKYIEGLREGYRDE